jgi:unsaturated chondroitin disaccharide hydrolase
LDQANKIAAFIINHPRTPADLIPYWDYDAPGIPNEPRDASAAAIIASSLLELSTYSSANKAQYFNYAERLLESLASDEYLACAWHKQQFSAQALHRT